MKPRIRSPLSVRHCVFVAIVFFGRALIAAPNNGDIREYDVPKQGSIVTMFPHFYPEWIAPGHMMKLGIESQINGVRRSRQVGLSIIRAGWRREYYFPFGIDTLSPRYIKAIVSVDNGVVRERLRNVFYDPSHRTVTLGADYESLSKILPSDKGFIYYLFTGPFRKGMTKAQRARALRNYQQTNYILFRLF